MSFLTGAGTNASQPTVYTGIKIQTSAQGVPITLMWGKNRVTPNLIWYNNFQAHKQSSKGGGETHRARRRSIRLAYIGFLLCAVSQTLCQSLRGIAIEIEFEPAEALGAQRQGRKKR